MQRFLFFPGLWVSTTLAISEAPRIVQHEIQIAAMQEMGMIEKGVFGGNVLEEIRSEWVDHFGAFITKSITVDDRLNISAGLGGIFQFRKPEKVIGGFPGSQRKAFFIGPTMSQAVYRFGNPEKPWLQTGVGIFPYKYNPDASNLGEYLFRAIPYPTVIFTGGYGIINGAGGYLQGMKANFALGHAKLDLFFLTETSIAPLYDGSIAAVGTYRVGNGFLELGAGIYFKRLLPVNTGRTSRKNVANAWFVDGSGRALSGDYNVYANQKTFWENKLSSATNPTDSSRFTALAGHNDSIVQIIDSVNLLPVSQRPELHYYTASGTLVMGRLSLDLKKILPLNNLEPAAARLYLEAAVLGWKNYPVFYQKRANRMPVMAGLNIPTFKLLDLFSIEVEYFDSPHLNNSFPIGSDGNNVPYIPDASDAVTSRTDYNDLTRRDNWKWSVLLKRNIHSNVSVSAQCANDHLRVTDANFYYGPQFNPNEITVSKRDWYWMLQLSWGM